MIKKIGLMLTLVAALQGCTILNTPVKEEWYQTDAKYTSITRHRSDIQQIHKGTDLREFPYTGDHNLYLLYEKTISGGDAAVYYGSPGNYLGFVYGAGPNKKNLNEKIDNLKNFVAWSNQTKTQRLASEGKHIEIYDTEYIYLEHPAGPIMLVRETGSLFYCTLQRFCYGAFINPQAAQIMVEELSRLRDTKFSH